MADDQLCPNCSAPNPRETVFCGKCGSRLANTSGEEAKKDPFVGAFVGDRFLVHQKLGEGGMGVVYRAEQTAIKRKVALKVLHAHLTRDESLHARFHNEAAASSRLSHPNTVVIYDFGKTDAGSLYIAMEYIDGISLDDDIGERGSIQWMRACRIAMQICGSLSDAHNHNIVHRDLKPENIMLCERGGESDVVKVLDFGIAKMLEDEGTDQRQALTKTGMVFGTPQYMSPEQIRGEKVDHRSDIYSMGVILYQMLTGVLPFTADKPMGLLSKHLLDAPPSFKKANSGVNVPEALERLVMSALSKEPDKRPATMAEFKRCLAGAADLSQENTVLSPAESAPPSASLPGALQGAMQSTLLQTASVDTEFGGKKNLGLIMGVVVVVLLITSGGIGVWLYTDSSGGKVEMPPLSSNAGLASGKGGIPGEPGVNGKFPEALPVAKKPGATLDSHVAKQEPKEVPCTFRGATDVISSAIRTKLRDNEEAIKKCVGNSSGGSTAFRFEVVGGRSKLDKIQIVTSSVMDACLRRQLEGQFNGNVKKTRKGEASFRLERHMEGLKICEVTINTELKPAIGRFSSSGKVNKPKKPRNKDKEENKKNVLPITITREE